MGIPRPEGFPDTPENDKITDQIRNDAAAVAEFLEFMAEKGIVLANETAFGDLMPCLTARSTLIHQFCGLDEDKLERERAAILAFCRANQVAAEPPELDEPIVLDEVDTGPQSVS